VPPPAQQVAPTQSYGYSGRTSYDPYPVRQQEGSAGGALAHFSGFLPLMVLGPGIGYAVSSPGSVARRESAKAFNFQLVSLLGLIIGGTLGAITDWGIFDFVLGLGAIAWVVLTIVGGVKAAQGADWQNPVTKVVKLKVLPEK
jgi:uncharacterized Tic20 family protein